MDYVVFLLKLVIFAFIHADMLKKVISLCAAMKPELVPPCIAESLAVHEAEDTWCLGMRFLGFW